MGGAKRAGGRSMPLGNSPNRVTILPPDFGSFPLDREGKCKEFMLGYLQCVSRNRHDGLPCEDVAKRYLECRMNKGLMAKTDLKGLGYFDHGDEGAQSSIKIEDEGKKKETAGFTAGSSRAKGGYDYKGGGLRSDR